MLTQVWEKYLLKELVKTLVFVLCAFYVLYVVVDYSMHSKSLSKLLTSTPEFIKYYAFQLSKRADIILPMSLLFAVLLTYGRERRLLPGRYASVGDLLHRAGGERA